MNKMFNVTHQFQPFIAEEITFHIVGRLSTDVLKSKLSSSSVVQSSQECIPCKEPKKREQP